jgi:hypothetical protein
MVSQVFGEAQPRRYAREIFASESHRLSALCGGKAAFIVD